MKSRTAIQVTFRVESGLIKAATGREAQCLIALFNAGSKGITSLETFKAGWAVRLGAYVFDLKRMGVAITTTREPHEGDNHGRYTLACRVEIVEISGADAAELAVAA